MILVQSQNKNEDKKYMEGVLYMKPFKRTIEKALSWIANILLIVITGSLWFMYSSNMMNDPKFVSAFKQELARRQDANIGYSAEQLIEQLSLGFKYYSLLYLGLTVIAIIATILIKKRILAGVLLLIIAIVTAVTSVGLLLPIYLLHFIAAIMLFVRKEQEPMQSTQSTQTINYL